MIDESSGTKGSSSSSTGRQKGKRSLFSVLFNSKSSKTDGPVEDRNNNNSTSKDKPEEKMNNNQTHKLLNERLVSESPKEKEEVEKKEDEEEEDSYEHDLNQRLECEKSKRNQRNHSAPPRQTPEGGSWCTNVNYIPRGSQNGRSPLLEQFLSSHQIQFDSIDFSGSDDDEEDEQLGKKANFSSGDSLAERVARMMSGAGKKKAPEGLMGTARNSVDERDLRLVQWRLLASKSACSASSLPSSDSELDLIDCQRPALAIACSDDTSCSSVELIWSRGCNQAEATTVDLPHLIENRFAQISNLQKPEPKLGLTHEADHLNVAARYPGGRRSLKPDKSVNKRASNCESSSALHGLAHRRLSIFELARSSRAKDKRFDVVRKPKRSTNNANTNTNILSAKEQWVENPLFSESDEHTATSDRADVRCASCDESVIIGGSNDDGIHDRQINSLSSRKFDEGNSTDDSRDRSQANEEKLWIGKRWSMRAGGRSPFNVSNHIMNLDRKIKSNVSSLKSQLSVRISDTGKRASILADQLITSIKDTTKEQLFSGGTKDDSMVLNSFADTDPAKDPATTEKARLFSLIYKHQQHSNGQQVITRQPLASGALSSLGAEPTSDKSRYSPLETLESPEIKVQSCSEKLVETSSDKGQSESGDLELLPPSGADDGQSLLEAAKLISKAVLDEPVATHEETSLTQVAHEPTKQLEPTSINHSIILSSSGSSSHSSSSSSSSSSGSSNSSSTTSEAIFHNDAFVNDDTNATGHQSAAGTSVTSARETELGDKIMTAAGKRRKRRRQINVAIPSDDEGEEEGEEFYQKEFDNLASISSGDNSSQRQRSHRLRSLNYWRRLRSRVSRRSIRAAKLNQGKKPDS